MPTIKLYIGLVLKRLKRFSNIKPFSSVFFHFYVFEWNMVQSGVVQFLKKYSGNGQKSSILGT